MVLIGKKFASCRYFSRKLKLIRLNNFTSCSNIVSFLDRGKRRNKTYCCKTIFQLCKLYRLGQKKQNETCDLVQNAMYGYEHLSSKQSPNNITQFDGCNDDNPYPHPLRYMNHRQQFIPNNYHKNKICNCIESCAKTAITVCLSCNNSIDHVTKTTEEICNIKR